MTCWLLIWLTDLWNLWRMYTDWLTVNCFVECENWTASSKRPTGKAWLIKKNERTCWVPFLQTQTKCIKERHGTCEGPSKTGTTTRWTRYWKKKKAPRLAQVIENLKSRPREEALKGKEDQDIKTFRQTTQGQKYSRGPGHQQWFKSKYHFSNNFVSNVIQLLPKFDYCSANSLYF